MSEETNEKKDGIIPKTKSATHYEMERCLKNDSKETVIRRLKRSAMPVAILIVFFIIIYLLK